MKKSQVVVAEEKSMKQIRAERSAQILNLIKKMKKTTNRELVEKSGLNIFIVNGVISGLIFNSGVKSVRVGKESVITLG